MTTKRNGLSGQRRPREEQAEGDGVQFALAHDAERGVLLAVDRDVQLDLAAWACSLEDAPGRVPRSMLAKHLPVLTALSAIGSKRAGGSRPPPP